MCVLICLAALAQNWCSRINRSGAGFRGRCILVDAFDFFLKAYKIERMPDFEYLGAIGVGYIVAIDFGSIALEHRDIGVVGA